MGLGLANWDRLPPAERRTMQARRLAEFLRRRVLPFSPFYREKFQALGLGPRTVRSLDDLRRLPFTTKQDLLPGPDNPEGPRRIVLAPTPETLRERLPRTELLRLLGRRLLGGETAVREAVRAEFAPCTLFFTTGRTAGAIPFLLTRHDHAILNEAGRRIVKVLGVDPASDRILNLFPYAPHLAFWQTYACGYETGTLSLNTGGGRVMPADRLLGALERLKPTLIVGMPGYVYHLLRIGVAESRDFRSVRLVALGGENVAPGLKRKIAAMLEGAGAREVRVCSVLGFTEARHCWSECPGAPDTGFHTYPDFGIFEVVDPEGEDPLPPGTTGELVYTCLDGRGSVLIRYRTGDIVEGGVVEEPCPGCGRIVPRIRPDIRRRSNIKSLDIGKVKGTLVNLNSLIEVFAGDPTIEEWQLEITKRNNDPFETDELILYCAIKPGTDEVSFRSRVQKDVLERTEVRLNAIVVESIPSLLTRIGMEERTKEERILDRRKEILDRVGGGRT
jgi:phenylacetate-CoA ligase